MPFFFFFPFPTPQSLNALSPIRFISFFPLVPKAKEAKKKHRKSCGGLYHQKGDQSEDLNELLNIAHQGVESLALFPQWEHLISASKGKKEP